MYLNRALGALPPVTTRTGPRNSFLVDDGPPKVNNSPIVTGCPAPAAARETDLTGREEAYLCTMHAARREVTDRIRRECWDGIGNDEVFPGEEVGKEDGVLAKPRQHDRRRYRV